MAAAGEEMELQDRVIQTDNVGLVLETAVSSYTQSRRGLNFLLAAVGVTNESGLYLLLERKMYIKDGVVDNPPHPVIKPGQRMSCLFSKKRGSCYGSRAMFRYEARQRELPLDNTNPVLFYVEVLVGVPFWFWRDNRLKLTLRRTNERIPELNKAHFEREWDDAEVADPKTGCVADSGHSPQDVAGVGSFRLTGTMGGADRAKVKIVLQRQQP